MNYCIESNVTTILFLVFVLGFWLGYLLVRRLSKPKIPKWSVVMTAPMANDIKSRSTPPKPPHNPHK